MNRRRALMMAGEGGGYEHGTWEDLFYHIDKGDYATAYSIGEILPLDLGTEGVVNAKIVGFDKDNKNPSGKAKVSLVSQYLLKTAKRFNPALAGESGNYTLGTGGIGGWASSEIRSYVRETIYPLIPATVRNRIVDVKKTTKGFNTAGTQQNGQSSIDNIWLPSMKEITDTQDSGIFYGRGVVGTQHTKPGGSNIEWSGRSCSSIENRYAHNSNGYANAKTVANSYPFLIGFCID